MTPYAHWCKLPTQMEVSGIIMVHGEIKLRCWVEESVTWEGGGNNVDGK